MGLDAPSLEKQTVAYVAVTGIRGRKAVDMRNGMMFIVGFMLIIGGMTMVLREWPSVVIVFKGVIGAVVAVAGLVVLFAASLKK